ncbi:MAG: OmpA family protein [Gammaproteobacteria bacterium]|nr:OmpA family protein [Gammaproteobacteria bacterium]
MRVFICAIAASIVALASAGDAYADAQEGERYFTVMGSYIDDDKDRNVDDGINGGQFGFGWAFNKYLNVEALYMAGRGNGSPDEAHTGIGVDLQAVFRRDQRFSPYVFGGIGTFKIDPDGQSDSEDTMLSGGLGFYLDLFSTNMSLRGEWRNRTDKVRPTSLTDNLFSLGLQLPFGDGGPKWVDSDGDGVSDSLDRCPNTPAGTAVDSYGCELDSDGDGVKDSMDQCPNTPAGVRVDSNGCPMDSDGDGVPDGTDKCPNTPRGAEVDADGCELDSDGDGVVDRLDECPDTPQGAPVDNRGCEVEGEYVLEGVNFESNSDRLLAGATNVLDDVVVTLKRYPDIRFEVAGHTDSDGSAEYNESLSARRAQTVHDYLAANGIDVSRMTVRGYGEVQPIADNSTSAGKAQNRRVALNVVED